MSDDFDKEAEREKLREQFEADRQRREATQQMSELLLKGATMTNKHCDTCGDPIFRHEGQEFCANCQTAAGGGGETARDTGGAEAPARQSDDQAAAAGDEVDPRRAQPQSGDRTLEASQGERTAADGDDGVSEVPVEAESRRERAADRGRDADGRDPEPTTDRREEPPRQEPAAASTPDRPVETADADGLEAPAALQRALEKFSRQAAATDDPREAKHHLAAAREAAEALSALRR
jgi:uncharacterized Zn finger protein (UPF0148 family)